MIDNVIEIPEPPSRPSKNVKYGWDGEVSQLDKESKTFLFSRFNCFKIDYSTAYSDYSAEGLFEAKYFLFILVTCIATEVHNTVLLQVFKSEMISLVLVPVVYSPGWLYWW